MVTFSEVKSHFDANWNDVGTPSVTVIDKHKQYSTLYPNRLYVSVNEEPMIEDKSMNGHLKYRETFFWIYAVAESISDAQLIIRETSRLLTTKDVTSGQWSMVGKAIIMEHRNRYVAKIPCKEWKFASYTEW